MRVSKELVQHIAVFGESGSGKTVLLSTFYGRAKEPGFEADNGYSVASEDGRGHELHANYVGMRDSAKLPRPTRYRSTSYTFKVKPARHMKRGATPYEAIRLVWHDYPGEWLEGSVSGPEEEGRRTETLQSLVSSDVALLLVDGQRLLDNAGQEEAYLKVLLCSVRDEIARVREQLMTKGKLLSFPRIWIIALSKADLLPHLDVYGFRDLVIGKASAELVMLGEEIRGMLQNDAAFAIGEDFVLLSSAQFTEERIDVTKQVGVSLILPISTMLPLSRLLTWYERQALPLRAAEALMTGPALEGVVPLIASSAGGGVVKKAVGAVVRKAPRLSRLPILDIDGAAARSLALLAGDRLRELRRQAETKGEVAAAMSSSFLLALSEAEDARHLIRETQ